MASSLKQKMVIQGSTGAEDYNALKLIPTIKTKQDIKTFGALIPPIVPEDTVLRRCDLVKAPVTSTKSSVVWMYAIALFVGFTLPLKPLVFQVMKRAGHSNISFLQTIVDSWRGFFP